MHQKYFPKTDRLRLMQRSDAIATLNYLCKIGESDFALQLALKNPHWDLQIKDKKVVYCASFGARRFGGKLPPESSLERVLSPQTWHPQPSVIHA